MDSSLLLLYPSIVVTILSEWLYDIELCFLDTAVCNQRLRPKLVSLLTQCCVEYLNGYDGYCRFNTTSYCGEQYGWMCLRGIRPNAIYLTSFMQNHPSFRVLASILAKANHLRLLNVDVSADSTPLIDNISSIHTVKFSNSLENECLEALLKMVSVSNLDAALCTRLTNTVITRLPELCPDLKSLSVPHFGSILPVVAGCSLVSLRCNFDQLGLTDRPDTLTRCYCEVRSTQTYDESALCIAGKYFCLTYLEVDQVVTAVEAKYLRNLLGNLTSVRIENSCGGFAKQLPLIKALATKCEHLISLVIECSKFNEDWLMGLVVRARNALKTVQFSRCQGVTDMTIVMMAKFCSHLETFTLDDISVSDSAVVQLFEGCPSLNKVRYGNKIVSEAVLRHVARDMEVLSLAYALQGVSLHRTMDRGLKKIHFSANTLVPANEFDFLIRLNSGLRKLDLDNLVTLNNDSLRAVVESCPLLESVSLSSLSHLDVDGLMHLTLCKRLNSVTLSCMSITDAFVAALLSDRPEFVRIGLQKCTGFTGEVMLITARLCPGIKHVTVTNSVDVKNHHVISLLNSCTRLDSLNLQRCQSLDAAMLEPLKGRQMRKLDLKHVGIPLDAIDELNASGFSCCELSR